MSNLNLLSARCRLDGAPFLCLGGALSLWGLAFLERAVRIDVPSADLGAKSTCQVRISKRNPIFRCPPFGASRTPTISRAKKSTQTFFCTKFFDNRSGHGRPRRKSWSSAKKKEVRFPVAPVVGRNFLTLGHPGVRVRNVRGVGIWGIYPIVPTIPFPLFTYRPLV